MIQLVLPLSSQTCPHLLAGVLGVTRQIITNCQHCDEVEPLLLLYELSIKLTEHRDHNIVTASLETLQQVVKCGPPLLLYRLTSQAGLGKSRLSFDQVRIRNLNKNLLIWIQKNILKFQRKT